MKRVFKKSLFITILVFILVFFVIVVLRAIYNYNHPPVAERVTDYGFFTLHEIP